MNRADAGGSGEAFVCCAQGSQGHGERQACSRSINLEPNARHAPEQVHEVTLQRLRQLEEWPPPQAKKGWGVRA